VIANTRKILNTTTANEHDRVLLEVMSDTGNVCGYFNTIAKANTGNLAECRVRFLGRYGHDASAHTAALGASLESRTLGPVLDLLAALLDKLVNCRHLPFLLYSPWQHPGFLTK
jgi:hypothetical protein